MSRRRRRGAARDRARSRRTARIEALSEWEAVALAGTCGRRPGRQTAPPRAARGAVGAVAAASARLRRLGQSAVDPHRATCSVSGRFQECIETGRARHRRRASASTSRRPRVYALNSHGAALDMPRSTTRTAIAAAPWSRSTEPSGPTSTTASLTRRRQPRLRARRHVPVPRASIPVFEDGDRGRARSTSSTSAQLPSSRPGGGVPLPRRLGRAATADLAAVLVDPYAAADQPGDRAASCLGPRCGLASGRSRCRRGAGGGAGAWARGPPTRPSSSCPCTSPELRPRGSAATVGTRRCARRGGRPPACRSSTPTSIRELALCAPARSGRRLRLRRREPDPRHRARSSPATGRG